MSYLCLVLAIILSSFTGMASLNFAMNKPYKQLLTQKPMWLDTKFLKPIYLRFLGWTFLALALILSIKTWNFAIGITAFFGVLTLGGSMLIFLLSYQENWILKMMIGAVILLVFSSISLL